eukprot:3543720-Rhodomonas_salina.1
MAVVSPEDKMLLKIRGNPGTKYAEWRKGWLRVFDLGGSLLPLLGEDVVALTVSPGSMRISTIFGQHWPKIN